MVSGLHRPTKLVIDRQAIKANIQQEMQTLPQTTELWAVVKANGYGHGMVEVVTTAKSAGATGFCVAILDEALALRQAGFTEPILVLGITSPTYAKVAAVAHISLTVGSQEWLAAALPILQSGALTTKLAVILRSIVVWDESVFVMRLNCKPPILFCSSTWNLN